MIRIYFKSINLVINVFFKYITCMIYFTVVINANKKTILQWYLKKITLELVNIKHVRTKNIGE